MVGTQAGRNPGEKAGGAVMGLASLGAFGLALIWGAGCGLWIQSLMPSEAALPVFGLLYLGVLAASALGTICGILGLYLGRARRWIAALGLVLNALPWVYLLWLVATGSVRL